jgi:hypothetical protein
MGALELRYFTLRLLEVHGQTAEKAVLTQATIKSVIGAPLAEVKQQLEPLEQDELVRGVADVNGSWVGLTYHRPRLRRVAGAIHVLPCDEIVCDTRETMKPTGKRLSVLCRSNSLRLSLVLGLITYASSAIAQIGRVFPTLGDMTTARSSHTATLLGNGKVLIVGGTSADIFDPATRTFTATGAMTTARWFHTATRLDDGTVLIVGVEPFSGVTPLKSSADRYDPSTGTFTSAGEMVTAQIGSTATLLSNGKILIAGGVTSWCCQPATIASPELYDPSTGMFTLTGRFKSPGDGIYVIGGPNVSAAILLRDGRVLFACEPDSELYDPASGSFSLTGRMTTPCVLGGYPLYIYGRTATLLTNGKVLVTGGEHEDCGRFANAELYDPATETFIATGYMTRVRDNHRATLLPNSTVLISGGESEDCAAAGCFFSGTQASSEIYDPSMGTFAAADDMNARRADHTSTMLNNGTVLITGGYCYTGIGSYCGIFASAELHYLQTQPRRLVFGLK